MMKDYISSVIIAAIFCAVVQILLPPKSANGRITNLLCGILLAITVISPLTRLSFNNIADFMNGLTGSADRYIEDGQTAVQTEIEAIIKQETQAYILDKANQLGLQIAVEVALDENNHSIPSSVTITGILSPYTKEVLSGYIANTLGIAKETQIWISKG